MLALRQTPFGQIAHTLDVRRIASRRGRYNIPNVGLFVWRLRPYRITQGTAKRVKEGCYTCHPLGLDMPLFNPGRGEEEIAHLAEPVNVPEPLNRRPLYDELETMRQTLANGQPEVVATGALVYFDPRQPVFEVFKNGTPIPPKEILICDLSDWSRPPERLSYRPAGKRPGDPTPDIQNYRFKLRSIRRWAEWLFPWVRVSMPYGSRSDTRTAAATILAVGLDHRNPSSRRLG